MTRLSALLVLGALSAGCGPAAKPPPPAAKPQPAPAAVLADADWGRFRSQRQGLSVPLPMGAEWRIDDHTNRWLDAYHPATESRLRARSWIEPKPINRDDCEAQARKLAPDLPTVDQAGLIDDHISNDLFAPDFSSRVFVGVGDADPKSGALQGYVLAFGAAARQCVVMAFTTKVQGAKGSAQLANRLELGVRIAEHTMFLSRMPEGPLEPIETPR